MIATFVFSMTMQFNRRTSRTSMIAVPRLAPFYRSCFVMQHSCVARGEGILDIEPHDLAAGIEHISAWKSLAADLGERLAVGIQQVRELRAGLRQCDSAALAAVSFTAMPTTATPSFPKVRPHRDRDRQAVPTPSGGRPSRRRRPSLSYRAESASFAALPPSILRQFDRRHRIANFHFVQSFFTLRERHCRDLRPPPSRRR